MRLSGNTTNRQGQDHLKSPAVSRYFPTCRKEAIVFSSFKDTCCAVSPVVQSKVPFNKATLHTSLLGGQTFWRRVPFHCSRSVPEFPRISTRTQLPTLYNPTDDSHSRSSRPPCLDVVTFARSVPSAWHFPWILAPNAIFYSHVQVAHLLNSFVSQNQPKSSFAPTFAIDCASSSCMW